MSDRFQQFADGVTRALYDAWKDAERRAFRAVELTRRVCELQRELQNKDVAGRVVLDHVRALVAAPDEARLLLRAAESDVRATEAALARAREEIEQLKTENAAHVRNANEAWEMLAAAGQASANDGWLGALRKLINARAAASAPDPEPSGDMTACGECARRLETDWRWCPHCGVMAPRERARRGWNPLTAEGARAPDPGEALRRILKWTEEHPGLVADEICALASHVAPDTGEEGLRGALLALAFRWEARADNLAVDDQGILDGVLLDCARELRAALVSGGEENP